MGNQKKYEIIKIIVIDTLLLLNLPLMITWVLENILLMVSLANHSTMVAFISFIKIFFLYLLLKYLTLKVQRVGL